MPRLAHARIHRVAGLVLCLALGGCGLLLDSGWPPGQFDGGPVDMPMVDGGSPLDAAVRDARIMDATRVDARTMDAAGLDAGAADSGMVDAGPVWTAWATTLGGAGDESAETLDIIEGPEDYEVLVGLDGETFPSVTSPSAGLADILIAHYTSDGARIGARDRYYGGSGYDDIWAVIAAAAGQEFECGRVTGTVRFGTTDVFDGFVVARDSSGNPLWALQTQGPSCRGVAAFADGGAVTVSDSSSIASVEAFDALGDPQWSHRLGVDVAGVDTNTDGDVFVASTFTERLDLGSATFTSAGLIDSFVVRYTRTGGFMWSRRFGGTSSDKATAMTLDPSGNAVVVGWFRGTSDFVGSSLTSAGGEDLFVLSLTGDGDLRWARRFGGTRTDRAFAVSTDVLGNVYVTGTFSGFSDLGDGPIMAGGVGSFVLSLTADGDRRWSLPLVGDADVRGHAIAAAPDGSVWVAGEFRGTTSFGTPPLTSAGGTDAFLVKLQQTAP